jgi:hypothetical protein
MVRWVPDKAIDSFLKRLSLSHPRRLFPACLEQIAVWAIGHELHAARSLSDASLIARADA